MISVSLGPMPRICVDNYDNIAHVMRILSVHITDIYRLY